MSQFNQASGGGGPSGDGAWLVNDNGRQFGPHSLAELSSMLFSGQVSASALAWREGTPSWVPITSVVAAQSQTAPPPPGPPLASLPPGHSQAGPFPQQGYPPQPMQYATPQGAMEQRDVRSNRVAAGICGILLGGLGIHKFILGFNGAGITMLLITILTCGYGGIVMGIIGIIEGIIYLSKSDDQFQYDYGVMRKSWF